MPVGRWSLVAPVRRADDRSSDEARSGTARAPIAAALRHGLSRFARARNDRRRRGAALLGIYRRLEARGEIRGGRFVNGFVGEQFALPQAVDALRAARRNETGAGTGYHFGGRPVEFNGNY